MAFIKKCWDSYCYFRELTIFHSKNKLFSYGEALRRFWRNRHLRYTSYRISDMVKFKTSDTIFLIGSGPSLNSLTSGEIQEINKHDSFGLGNSFLKPELRTKFHRLCWHYGDEFWIHAKSLADYREDMKDVIIFINESELITFLHPRLVPENFPVDPKICYYRRPQSIGVDPRPFTDEDFDRTLFYRNAITLPLHYVAKMGHKKIVLLGVDPDKPGYFWENIPVMKGWGDLDRQRTQKCSPNYDGKQYYYMYPDVVRAHPFDVYLKGVESYLRRRRGIQLYVSHPSSVLYPDIPAYFV